MCRVMYHLICRFMDRTLCVLYVSCLVLLLPLANATEVPAASNHFQPTDNYPQSPRQPQQTDPLKAYPVAQYVVHGVIVMEDNAVAVVYTPRNTWHKLQVQSHLGQEQAVVRQITTKGIQIDIQDTLLWLPILQ